MSQAPRVQRIAELLIRAACRRLPADVRAERSREWSAELPAILDDPSIRPALLRMLRALTFCMGISGAARQLSRPARAGSRRAQDSHWRAGAMQARPPSLAVRTLVGLTVWLLIVAAVVTLGRALSSPPHWLVALGLVLAIGFDAFCVADITRAAQVRCLPKWAWALICLAQTPGGGIIYLSVGHIDRPRPVPPGGATS